MCFGNQLLETKGKFSNLFEGNDFYKEIMEKEYSQWEELYHFYQQKINPIFQKFQLDSSFPEDYAETKASPIVALLNDFPLLNDKNLEDLKMIFKNFLFVDLFVLEEFDQSILFQIEMDTKNTPTRDSFGSYCNSIVISYSKIQKKSFSFFFLFFFFYFFSL